MTDDLPLDQPNRNTETVLSTTLTRIRDLFAREIHPGQLSTFIHGPRL
ncbi:hypothetical protein [Gluconobacter sp.]